MTPESTAYSFRSDLFSIDPQEDEETNPFCYGKALAEWVRAKFEELGYKPEAVIAEDWGWCVMLERQPFMLWVGCGCDRSEFYEAVSPEQKGAFGPDEREVTWSCVVGADAPVWTAFFWKRLFSGASTRARVDIVDEQLKNVLANEPRIQLVAETA